MTDSSSIELPKAAPNQPTIQLRLLEAGDIYIPLWMFVTGEIKDKIQPCPSMAWLLHHPPSNTNLVFDLGLPKDITHFPPPVQERLNNVLKIKVDRDVYDSLEATNTDPQQSVNTVILSHLHYDHIGDPRHFGPHTEFIIGPGAGHLLKGPKTYPADPSSWFSSQLFPHDRTEELPPAEDTSFWKPLGPFPQAHDSFGDGSLYIINAPGHLPGHINLLVRVGPEKWIVLGGDSCHDVRILDGEKEISVYQHPQTGAITCAHLDKEAAEAHIRRLRKLKELPNVEVVLAHDWRWLENNKNRFL